MKQFTTKPFKNRTDFTSSQHTLYSIDRCAWLASNMETSLRYCNSLVCFSSCLVAIVPNTYRTTCIASTGKSCTCWVCVCKNHKSLNLAWVYWLDFLGWQHRKWHHNQLIFFTYSVPSNRMSIEQQMAWHYYLVACYIAPPRLFKLLIEVNYYS